MNSSLHVSSNRIAWSLNGSERNDGMLRAHFIDMNNNLAAVSYVLSVRVADDVWGCNGLESWRWFRLSRWKVLPSVAMLNSVLLGTYLGRLSRVLGSCWLNDDENMEELSFDRLTGETTNRIANNVIELNTTMRYHCSWLFKARSTT